MTITALDLFAGTGWGVACQQLGIEEHGVELMPEAVATREANGMRTIYHDVWEGLEGRHAVPDYDLLIASPPCQTFSMAGKGAGRAALDEVVGLIDSRAYLNVAALRAFGEDHDPRTALVLTPLAHVARDAPLYVVFEQVPTVLPVWEKCAEVMRRWGYSVVTGILNAEQYGVPQTRKRAILIARGDGVEARMPTPTHSAYYPRDKARLDPGVKPWVSMAEALDWGGGAVGFARIADEKGAATEDGYRARDLRETDSPAQVVTEKARSWTRLEQQAAHTDERRVREGDEPAFTVTSHTDRAWLRHNAGAHNRPRGEDGRQIVRDDEGGDYYQRFDVDGPAPTLTSGADAWAFDSATPDPERPGRWVVNDQSGGERDPDWPTTRPATTVATRDLVADPGHNVNRHDAAHVTKSRNDGIRVTVDEAAALQSYPPGFAWVGSKTSTFRQIGNAVPPLLGWHVLRAAIEGA